jgi:hypothetical protein
MGESSPPENLDRKNPTIVLQRPEAGCSFDAQGDSGFLAYADATIGIATRGASEERAGTFR